MQVEEGLELGRRPGRDMRLERGELLLGGEHRAVETHHFGVDRFRRHLVMRDFQPRSGNEVRVAYGDPA